MQNKLIFIFYFKIERYRNRILIKGVKLIHVDQHLINAYFTFLISAEVYYNIIVTANGCDNDTLLNYFGKYFPNFISRITIINKPNIQRI